MRRLVMQRDIGETRLMRVMCGRHWRHFMLMVSCALMMGPPGAQAQDGPLDRAIGTDHLGVPVVWAPEAIGNGLWARRIAQGARVPVVFEVAPPTPASGLPERVDLSGLTVRAALDALVARDPRYAWQQVGNTIVVRPTAAWADESHPLHRLAGEEAAGEKPLAEAVRQVVGGDASSADMTPLTASVDRGKRVTPTQRSRPTQLARLAELAAEGELFVTVRDPRITPGPHLDVANWDGRSYPVYASGASAAANEDVR
jgi:hypothetical protein